MAVTSRRVTGTQINAWYCLAIGPEAAVTDTFIQNVGEQDAYISVNKDWSNYITIKGGQSIALDSLAYKDIQNLWLSDDGNGTTIGILAVSR
jgi:hypothetical protein